MPTRTARPWSHGQTRLRGRDRCGTARRAGRVRSSVPRPRRARGASRSHAPPSSGEVALEVVEVVADRRLPPPSRRAELSIRYPRARVQRRMRRAQLLEAAGEALLLVARRQHAGRSACGRARGGLRLQSRRRSSFSRTAAAAARARPPASGTVSGPGVSRPASLLMMPSSAARPARPRWPAVPLDRRGVERRLGIGHGVLRCRRWGRLRTRSRCSRRRVGDAESFGVGHERAALVCRTITSARAASPWSACRSSAAVGVVVTGSPPRSDRSGERSALQPGIGFSPAWVGHGGWLSLPQSIAKALRTVPHRSHARAPWRVGTLIARSAGRCAPRGAGAQVAAAAFRRRLRGAACSSRSRNARAHRPPGEHATHGGEEQVGTIDRRRPRGAAELARSRARSGVAAPPRRTGFNRHRRCLHRGSGNYANTGAPSVSSSECTARASTGDGGVSLSIVPGARRRVCTAGHGWSRQVASDPARRRRARWVLAASVPRLCPNLRQTGCWTCQGRHGRRGRNRLVDEGLSNLRCSRVLAVVHPILLRRQVLYPLSYEGGPILSRCDGALPRRKEGG